MAILVNILAGVFLRSYARVMDAAAQLLTPRSETEKRLLAGIRGAERRSDLDALGALVARAEELTWGTQADLARSLIRMRRSHANVDGLLRELAQRSGEIARTDVFEVLSGTGDPLNAELFAGGIEHPDRFVRFWSAHGLATIGGLAARAGLAHASFSDDADLRLVAAHALPVEHPRVGELATDPDVRVARAAQVGQPL